MTTTKMIRAVEAIAYLLLAYSCNVAATAYEASTAVKKAHAIYHIDYNLQLASNTDWGITTKNVSLKDNEYLQSIIVFPLIILSIGGIIIFSLLIFWTLRYCGCMCFADRPTNTLLLRNPLVWVKAVAIRKNVLLGFFSVFTFLTVAAVTVSWYGFVLLRDNGTKTRDTLEEAAVMFKGIKGAGVMIIDSGNSITSSLAASPCAPTIPNYSDTRGATGTSIFNAEALTNSVSIVGPKLSYLGSIMYEYGVFHYKYAVSLSFAFVVAVCIMLTIGVIIRHKTLVIANVSIGIAVYIILLIILSVSMAGIIGVGDFCMDPYVNMLKSLPKGENLYQYSQYYVTCSPLVVDPLAQSTTDLASSLSSLVGNLETIRQSCPADPDVLRAVALAGSASQNLVDINALRVCPAIQTKLLASVGDGLCKNVFNGFFGVWLCFFVCLPCFFVTLATASVIYEYFDIKYWGAAEANAHLLTWQTTELPKEPEPVLEKEEPIVAAIEGHAVEIIDDKNNV